MEMHEDKVKQAAKDEAALRETLLLYGRSVYARLYEERGDKATALKALREAMAELIAGVGNTPEYEVSEETLYERAKMAQERLLFEQAPASAGETDAGAEEADTSAEEADASADKADASAEETDAGETPGSDPVEEFRAQAPLRERTAEKVKPGTIASLIGAIVLIIVALWMLTGLLMSMGVIGKLDLGYEWFNGNVIDWF